MHLIPAHNKTVSQNQFLFNGIKIWNLLSQSAKDVQEAAEFKLYLKVCPHGRTFVRRCPTKLCVRLKALPHGTTLSAILTTYSKNER